jgi:hypothetical protein
MDSSDSMRGLNKEDNSELNGSKADIMSIPKRLLSVEETAFYLGISKASSVCLPALQSSFNHRI